MMMKKQLKFKKLLNQYRSAFYDLEYVNEVLKEAYPEFEEYKRSYCNKKRVKVSHLNNKHSERLKKIFSTAPSIKRKTKPSPKVIPYDSKKLFRQIARKFHPDKLSDDDPRASEFEEVFKKASAAIDNHSWAELFDIAEKYNLHLDDYDSINKLIEKEILIINKEVAVKKNTYAWLLHHSDTDEEKDNLMKRFLNHLYKDW